MTTFNILTLREDFLIKTKKYGLDDQNQPVIYLKAQGGEPCRDVLRRAVKGENLILASYCPFSLSSPYKEYGPIFLLRDVNTESIHLNELPEMNLSGNSYLQDCFILRSYDKREYIVDSFVSCPDKIYNDLDRLFGQNECDFILVRSVTHGCYFFRINRPCKFTRQNHYPD